MHRDNRRRDAQKVAQGMGVSGDRRKAHHGKLIRIVLGKLDRAQDIIYGNTDFNDRQIRDLPNQSCRAASGKDDIIPGGIPALDNTDPFLQITGIHVHGNAGEMLCRMNKGDLHGFIRRNRQNTYRSFILKRHIRFPLHCSLPEKTFCFFLRRLFP